MGFQGDMLSKMKLNKSLLDVNRSHFYDYMKPFLTYKKSKLKINHVDLSAEEIEEIKIRIKKQEKHQRKIASVVSIVSMLILLVLIIWGIKELNSINVRFRF
jgi:hypothetical protein